MPASARTLSLIFSLVSLAPTALWLALIHEAFALWFLEKETLILVTGNLDDSHQQLEKCTKKLCF